MNANEQFYSQPSNLSMVKTYSKKNIQRGGGRYGFDAYPKFYYQVTPSMKSPIANELRKLGKENASARNKLFYNHVFGGRRPNISERARLNAFIKKTNKRMEQLVDENNRNYKSDHRDFIYKDRA